MPLVIKGENIRVQGLGTGPHVGSQQPFGWNSMYDTSRLCARSGAIARTSCMTCATIPGICTSSKAGICRCDVKQLAIRHISLDVLVGLWMLYSSCAGVMLRGWQSRRHYDFEVAAPAPTSRDWRSHEAKRVAPARATAAHKQRPDGAAPSPVRPSRTHAAFPSSRRQACCELD